MTDPVKNDMGPGEQLLKAFQAPPNAGEAPEKGKIAQVDVLRALRNTLEDSSCAVVTAALRDPTTGEITSGLAAFERGKDHAFKPMLGADGKPMILDNSDAFANFTGKSPEDTLGSSRRTISGLAMPQLGGGLAAADRSPVTVAVEAFDGNKAQCGALRKTGLSTKPSGM